MDSPVEFFKRMLLDLAKKNVSGLHLSVGSVPMLRSYGRLSEAEGGEILKKEDLEKILRSFLSEEELNILADKKELLIVKDFGENFRFRVNIFFQKESPAISLSYISETIADLDSLGFPNTFTKNLLNATGLLIVAGPPASGKTSTIAAIIERINKEKNKYIITVEDPIEKIFVNKKSLIDQRQVGRDVNDFFDGLRHCLEEDVDVVYVDEIRVDFELALPYVLELASGNTLVILEVNAENSIRALEKILNTSSKNLTKEAVHFMMADVLFGVVAQRLIPNRESGLSLALEVLLSNFAVKSLIREGNIYQLEGIIQNSAEEGMISMEKSIKDLVLSGEIDRTEAGNIEI
ncbi:MAG TPA: ATPase, T2SS/T4P/T4SS family [Candidatus Nanoarchaeia archaeon]|nr:ATPase, T2SS/T4P/T4SS family [Candidatus Nanoarchaeia archaeon]